MTADPQAALSEHNAQVAEGAIFEQAGNHEKAIGCYTKAIEALLSNGVLQNPVAIHCLCARSKCYLALGDPDAALDDAEACLKEDKDFIKGLCAKAEALYFRGDFEFALVFFHRGHQIRPDVESFRLGIQKAREAIDNAIGNTERCRLRAEGDLTAFYRAIQQASGKSKNAVQAGRRRAGTSRARSTQSAAVGGERTVKQLLGELYADKAYLEELLADPSMALGQGDDVKALASSGIRYLDKRTEFWRQQKPIYARVNEQKAARAKQQNSKSARHLHDVQRATDRCIRALSKAEQALEEHKDEEAKAMAEQVVEMLAEVDAKRKARIEAQARSVLGSCHLNADTLTEALCEHQKDLELSRAGGEVAGINRALGNVGRVYARQHQMDKAIRCWEEKATICTDALESAWLHHEIGRAQLALNKAEPAAAAGSTSKQYAKEAASPTWLFNASLLIAQANAAMAKTEEAMDAYTEALALAEQNNTVSLQPAIQQEIDKLRAQQQQQQPTAPTPAPVPVPAQ